MASNGVGEHARQFARSVNRIAEGDDIRGHDRHPRRCANSPRAPNCRAMRVWPTPLCEVISVTLAILPRYRSSGLATLVATVSGLAPGSCAWTEMVGKSTCGSAETGNLETARMPASAIPIVSNVVATGRAMNGADRFIGVLHHPPCEARISCQPIEIQIEYGNSDFDAQHDDVRGTPLPASRILFRPIATSR